MKTGGTWSVQRQVGPRPQPYWLPKLEPDCGGAGGG